MGTRSRLRIALVSHFPDVDGSMSSGVAGVAAALADGLAKAGNEVHVATCVRGIRRIEERTTAGGVVVHSVPSLGRLAWLIGFPVEVAGVRTVLRAISPDIVHCHTQTVYAEAALERGWPSVLTIHGLYEREILHMRPWRRVQGRRLLRFERAALKRAKHIVCISEYLRREIGQVLDRKDVRLIENPIDDRWFDVWPQPEQGRVLYAGTVIHRKNLLYLLEAVRLLAGRGRCVHLVVAGSKSVEPEYFDRCMRFVEKNGLSGRVEFRGTLSTDGLLEEFSRANLLVLPSRQETAPMVISEAMAAGLPIVTTPAGGSAEMVEDGRSGFVAPFDDVEGLAVAIDKLISDLGLASSMGRHGRSQAELRFKCSAVVERTLAFYEDILR
jgi:glycosyltransferase involved in cell wall biosynthesis